MQRWKPSTAILTSLLSLGYRSSQINACRDRPKNTGQDASGSVLRFDDNCHFRIVIYRENFYTLQPRQTPNYIYIYIFPRPFTFPPNVIAERLVAAANRLPAIYEIALTFYFLRALIKAHSTEITLSSIFENPIIHFAPSYFALFFLLPLRKVFFKMSSFFFLFGVL